MPSPIPSSDSTADCDKRVVSGIYFFKQGAIYGSVFVPGRSRAVQQSAVPSKTRLQIFMTKHSINLNLEKLVKTFTENELVLA